LLAAFRLPAALAGGPKGKSDMEKHTAGNKGKVEKREIRKDFLPQG
jgi:hypothetical protein